MRKTLILCAVCCASVMMLAQTRDWAQQLVNNIATDISVSSNQLKQLQTISNEYMVAMQEANERYTDDIECTKAKEAIFKAYQSSLKEILTEEQYAELMRVREERRNQRITQ